MYSTWPVLSLSSDSQSTGTQELLQTRQREYKLAALRAKQEGNIEMATKYYRIAKVAMCQKK